MTYREEENYIQRKTLLIKERDRERRRERKRE